MFWVTLGEHADPLGAQLDLLARLGVTDTDVRSITQATRALREALAPRQCLLIVDDVWSAAAAKALAVTGPSGRVVYTTRDPRALEAIGAQIQPVDVLSDKLACALLVQLSGTNVAEFPADVDRVLAGTARVALALALVAAAVRGGSSWAQVAAELDRGERIFGTHPYANIFKALQLAVGNLDKTDTDHYLSLAVFPSDTRVPLPVIGRYWRRLHGDSAEQTEARLREFADRRLLSLDAEGIGFHDLQHDYLLLQAEDLDLLHADLLAAYRDLLSAPDQWWQLPADEPYLWHHLIHHLHGAGHSAELTTTVTDPAYLITRAFLHGPPAAEADLRRAHALQPHPDQDWWQQWFGHYGHLLANLPTRADAAATAALRLYTTPPSDKLRRLNALRTPPHLTPLWGLAPAPQNLRRILTGHQGAVRAVVFSPDGRLLASAGGDGTVRVWEAGTGAERAVLPGHQGAVTAVVFSPDGRLLASASWDGTVRVWDPATGLCRTVKLGLSVHALTWHNALLGVAVDSSVVVLRLTHALV